MAIKPDTTVALQNRAESLADNELPSAQDTIPGVQDSLKVEVNGIETTIEYYAKDSIITRTKDNTTYLYGDARIKYDKIDLLAAIIIIDRNNNELIARGVQDSTGIWRGRPIFQDAQGVYETEEIRYNFITQRARIKGVATDQPDGQLQGDVIKRNPDQSAYILNGKYIPCLDDPDAQTFIKAKKIKINPGVSVITGPFLLYVGGIPTPLGLPFGYFPDTREATSGILFPKYGDEQRRGLFLREGGWYQAWNEKVHSAFTADVYSKGSWGLKARTVYKNRYKYSGSLDVSFNRNYTNPLTDENPLDSQDFWVSWTHRPDSKGRNSRFSASVRAGTSSFNQNNLSTVNFSNNIRSEFRSNVNFSGTIPRSPFNYTISARHNQNVQTKILDVSLPEFGLNMNRVYPMKGSKADILKSLNVGWRFNASNRITNLVRPGTAGFDIANRTDATDTIAVQFQTLDQLLDNATNGAQHNIDLSTSFSIKEYFNFTPSFNIQELWYLEELNYQYLEDENAVRIDTIRGFSRAMTYSAGVGVSTQIYGMYPAKRLKNIEAIRHIVTPSINFTYRPDFSEERFGYYQTVQTDTASDGSPITQQLSIYDGFRFGSPTLGEAAALSFQVSNKLEMKVKNDTAQSRKVSIIDNLSLAGGYNFLADSFKLSTIAITARTSLFNKKVQINMGAILDPYTYVTSTSEGITSTQRISKLALRSSQGLGRLTSARFSLSTNLNSRANSSNSRSGAGGFAGGGLAGEGDLGSFGEGGDNPGQFGSLNDGGIRSAVPEYFYDPNGYVDITIPWNIRLSFDYSYLWTTTGTTTRQSVKANGQLELTPKWQLTYNTGYDFDQKEFTQTSIGVYRDLGCWEMRANWIPFGAFTSYTIDIQIKTSALKDLKISRRRSQFDRSF
ncbi:putative LPS assembly protein LptD [Roseivirga sp.]|uniref:putative LPS assembly protein LptD n=1 Tax=Roseivirga sp. TaxID=1964215 RepID=UPI003B8C489D